MILQEGQQTIEVSEASTGAGKKSRTSKASLEPQVHIKADWIIEHASQVAPLIPGGTGCPRTAFMDLLASRLPRIQ